MPTFDDAINHYQAALPNTLSRFLNFSPDNQAGLLLLDTIKTEALGGTYDGLPVREWMKPDRW